MERQALFQGCLKTRWIKRTIKAIAGRGETSPTGAVFWYNISSKSGQSRSMPQSFKYPWRRSRVVPITGHETPTSVRIEEDVWIKPLGARYTKQWRRRTITGVESTNNVSVNDVPQHDLDLRPVISSPKDEECSEALERGPQAEPLRRSRRDYRFIGIVTA